MNIHRPVLVVNASYEAVNVCTAKRAMTLIFKGAAVVEELSAYKIRTAQMDIPIPSVIRLCRYRKMPRLRIPPVTRKGIILRDHSTCQYCTKNFAFRDLTMDHVVPKSKGGPSTWENLVASCIACNNRKDDMTPDEAGMPLLNKPHRVGFHARHRMMSPDPLWDPYLFH